MLAVGVTYFNLLLSRLVRIVEFTHKLQNTHHTFLFLSNSTKCYTKCKNKRQNFASSKSIHPEKRSRIREQRNRSPNLYQTCVKKSELTESYHKTTRSPILGFIILPLFTMMIRMYSFTIMLARRGKQKYNHSTNCCHSFVIMTGKTFCMICW